MEDKIAEFHENSNQSKSNDIYEWMIAGTKGMIYMIAFFWMAVLIYLNLVGGSISYTVETGIIDHIRNIIQKI